MIRLKIKDLLNKKNKSTYWLTKKTSLTSPAIYKIVKGNTEGIQFNTLEEIMQALEITDFNEILEIIPEKKANI
ncbi:MAG: helix-turn-helix transcriptional regulator [Firmicutes bacterium]|nr:helix-turn-helix transcriptional regulator [Bacillota bacterium]